MKPTIKVTSKDMTANFRKDLVALSKMQVYVGIPQSTNDRGDRLLARATKLKRGGKRQMKLVRASELGISNAELVYIHTHGSYLRGIPARPIIEPSIELPENKEAIALELKLAAAAALAGKRADAMRHLKRAGLTGQNAIRSFFTDPRNAWAPNAPSTIRRKGSSRPLIDYGEMRAAMTYVVDEGTG